MPCPPPFLTLPFSKKEQMLLRDRNMPDSFDGFCSLPPSILLLKFLATPLANEWMGNCEQAFRSSSQVLTQSSCFHRRIFKKLVSLSIYRCNVGSVLIT